jgi:predicted dehydrogenase
MTSTPPRQRPTSVGVVGLSASGGWAATAHVPALAGLDGYELRALSASSDESARAAAEKYAVPLTFGSAEELARCEEVDLVVVTVRVPQHLELIRPAIDAGTMVLSEWPLGADLAQAEPVAAKTGTARHSTAQLGPQPHASRAWLARVMLFGVVRRCLPHHLRYQLRTSRTDGVAA